MKRRFAGFTLMEMLVALAIIGLLATFAVPQYGMYMARHRVADAASLADGIKEKIHGYYLTHGTFPADNHQADVPPPDKLLGNYVVGMRVEEGAIHIDLGNKAGRFLQNKTLSLRPITVDGSPESPMSWVCGNSEVPPGMSAAGRNLTDIRRGMLPLSCRESHQL